MIKKGNQSKTDQYLEESASWEHDRQEERAFREKIAWSAAGFCAVLALVAVAAVAMLVPLKTTEAFVIRINETTGETDIVTAVEGIKHLTHQEALDRYWIAKYVRLREGYFYPTVKRDYKLVMLMSASTAAKEYKQYMNPTLNPNSPILKYRGSVEMSVEISSISFLGDHTALVRFEKTIDRKNGPSTTSSWVATLQYKYRPQRPMSMQERMKNPLGFTVGRYRVTPEVTPKLRGETNGASNATSG